MFRFLWTLLEQNTQTAFPRGLQLYTHTTHREGDKLLKEKHEAERNIKMEQMNWFVVSTAEL